MKTEYTKKYNSEDDNSSDDNKSSSDEEEGKKSNSYQAAILPIVIQPKELAKVATPTTQTKHEVYDVVFVSYGFICFRKIWVICLYAIMLDKTMFKALL